MRRIASGDASALAELYDQQVRTVYSLVVRIVADQTDAEEVLQEVFTQVWRKAEQFDSTRGSAAAWLLTMARSRAIDHLRARRARPDHRAASSEHSLRELESVGIDPVTALVAEEDTSRIRKALAALAPTERTAIELAYYEGLSQSEIARHLGTPLGTIKTRIRAGLMKLRDSLGGD